MTRLHEDDESIFSSFSNKFDNRYQVLAIVGDNSEELDENNNPVLNPANINRGARLFPGAAELTTHLLRLTHILWLPLCRINKFG
jgi:hypothetical protein